MRRFYAWVVAGVGGQEEKTELITLVVVNH